LVASRLALRAPALRAASQNTAGPCELPQLERVDLACRHAGRKQGSHRAMRLGPTIDQEDDYQRYVKGANILGSLYGAK
jgi:hypothetical protein